MVAFARLASVVCERVAPDADSYHGFALQKLIKPSLTEKEIAAREKEVKSFEIVWDLRDGVDAMPPRWSKRVF